ncbi:MAG: hypothetical protein WCQ57_12375, partial [Verrucomicrobiota bacterium]
MKIFAIFFFLGAVALNAHASDLTLNFQPNFSGSPLLLDSLRYSNSAKETLSFNRLSFLLSGFAL